MEIQSSIHRQKRTLLAATLGVGLGLTLLALAFLSTPAAAGLEASYPQQKALSAPAPTLAATGVFTVADGDVAGLIAAIHAANQAGAPDAPAVVNLAAGGYYTLTAVDNEETGRTGLPVITGTVTISGNGATIARDTAEETPVFRILYSTGSLRLDSVTLNNGYASGGSPRGSGGALLNVGDATLINSTIQNSYAEHDGGGIANIRVVPEQKVW